MSFFSYGSLSYRQRFVGEFWPFFVYLHRLFTPHLSLDTLSPILVLGNQKTGSTAIAQLLAAFGNLSISPDLHPLQNADTHLPNDPDAVSSFIQKARYYFRRDVVKENELTPATDALLKVLPNAKATYVVRHPVHNIRSILDRVSLPGRPVPLDKLDDLDGGWRSIVNSRSLGIDADDHITSLAKRWDYITDIYLRNRHRLHLVRYEDFVADKRDTIHVLADRLGIPQKQDVQPLLDVSFQPRGEHRSTPPTDFFSAHALAIIHRECADGMDALAYSPIRSASAS